MANGTVTAADQIFAKVFQHTATSPEDRALLRETSSRKSGGELQGALESAKQQQGGQPEGDSLQQAIDGVKSAAQNVKQAGQKQLLQGQKLELRKELMGNAGIQELIKLRGQLGKETQEQDLGVEKSELARPTQLGALKGSDLGRLIQATSDVSGQVASRGGAIEDVLDRVQQTRAQEIEIAQANQQAQSSLLRDIITSRKAPLELAKLRADTARTNQLAAGGDGTTTSTSPLAAFLAQEEGDGRTKMTQEQLSAGSQQGQQAKQIVQRLGGQLQEPLPVPPRLPSLPDTPPREMSAVEKVLDKVGVLRVAQAATQKARQVFGLSPQQEIPKKLQEAPRQLKNREIAENFVQSSTMSTMSAASKKTAENHIANLLTQGRKEDADRFVKQLELSNLPADQQNRRVALNTFDGLLEEIAEGAHTVNVKATIEDQKNYILQESGINELNFPDIADFTVSETARLAMVQGNSFQDPFSPSIFGASIFPGEGVIANRVIDAYGPYASLSPNLSSLVSNRIMAYNLVKTMGETGRLSDLDLAIGMSNLPTLLDTQANAIKKIERLRRVLGTAKATADGTHVNTVWQSAPSVFDVDGIRVWADPQTVNVHQNAIEDEREE